MEDRDVFIDEPFCQRSHALPRQVERNQSRAVQEGVEVVAHGPHDAWRVQAGKAVFVREVHQTGLAPGVVDEIDMTLQDALGVTGGAACVDDERRGLGSNLEARAGVRLRTQDVFEGPKGDAIAAQLCSLGPVLRLGEKDLRPGVLDDVPVPS